MRCFARFVRLKGLTNKRDIRVSTNGRMVLTVTDDDPVRVNMGEPNFEPSAVPFRANKAEKTYIMRAAEQTILCGVVSMGNPHCVIQVDDADTAAVEKRVWSCSGKLRTFSGARQYRFYAKRCVLLFCLRVYERGAGETQPAAAGACGGGGRDSAVRFAGRRSTRGTPWRSSDIAWKGPGHPLYMTGLAVHVYDGFIHLYEATRGRTAGNTHGADDRAVVDYLIKNPEFFIRNARAQ